MDYLVTDSETALLNSAAQQQRLVVCPTGHSSLGPRRLELLRRMLERKIGAGAFAPVDRWGELTDEASALGDRRDQLSMEAWGAAPEQECGTCACLGGFATLDGPLRAHGLRAAGELTDLGELHYLTPCLWNGHETLLGDAALAHFFGLHPDAVDDLFGAARDSRPDRVLARIDDALACKCEPTPVQRVLLT